MLDEFLKIAAACPPGRLVNADLGKNQFPDVDVSGTDTPNRRDTRGAAANVSGPAPNPEERTSVPSEQHK